MALTLYYLRGLPASGKSTWAKAKLAELGPNAAKRVNKDMLRSLLDDGQWSRGNEKFVVDIETQIVEAALKNGRHVIVDNTGFAQTHIDRYEAIAKAHGAKFEIVDFTHVPVEECIKRDLKRLESVGESVIRGMYEQYLRPAPRPHNPTLPKAVICDLDGTLCDLGDRNPYDASTCGQDRVRTHVRAALIGICMDAKAVPVFMSGRSDKHENETLAWIMNTALIVPEHLYMRAEGDTRRDSIVKREMFDRHIEGKFDVIAICDDRPQVIKECWRELGFYDRILDVGTGKEF